MVLERPFRTLGWRGLAKGLGLILGLTALGFGLKYLESHGALTSGWVDREIRGQGLLGVEIFLLIASVCTALGLPRQATAFMAGYAFGALDGLMACMAANLIGSAATFIWARLVGRSFVRRRFPGKVRRMDDLLADNVILATLLIRLLPVGSNAVTNLAAGVSSVPFWSYMAGSAVGFLPQNLIFSILGSGVHVDPTTRLIVSIVLFVASGGLGVALWRRFKPGQTPGDEGAEE